MCEFINIIRLQDANASMLIVNNQPFSGWFATLRLRIGCYALVDMGHF